MTLLEDTPSWLKHRAEMGSRALFPSLQPRAYLGHAGISPASQPVQEAVQAVTLDYATRGLLAYGTWNHQRARLRATIASLLRTTPDTLALTDNTTRGVLTIALSLAWRPRERVMLFEGEFPSNVTPWQQAAKQHDLTVVMIPRGIAQGETAPLLEAIEAELRRGVRLVAVSAVQFQQGRRMPIESIAKLCRTYGSELFVDAVQAVGAIPVDVQSWDVDYLACGSHKWLMGLEGAGFLYVRPSRLPALRPWLAGWLSHEDALAFLFEGEGKLLHDRPIRVRTDFLEPGNCSAASFAALEASIHLIDSLGVASVHAHVTQYLDALEQGLQALGFTSLRSANPTERSNILSVLCPVPIITLHKKLLEMGIVTSTPDGRLRFAPHWPNALSEVPFVLDAVRDAVHTIRNA